MTSTIRRDNEFDMTSTIRRDNKKINSTQQSMIYFIMHSLCIYVLITIYQICQLNDLGTCDRTADTKFLFDDDLLANLFN